jgi:hypothetical protein
MKEHFIIRMARGFGITLFDGEEEEEEEEKSTKEASGTQVRSLSNLFPSKLMRLTEVLVTCTRTGESLPSTWTRRVFIVSMFESNPSITISSRETKKKRKRKNKYGNKKTFIIIIIIIII